MVITTVRTLQLACIVFAMSSIQLDTKLMTGLAMLVLLLLIGAFVWIIPGLLFEIKMCYFKKIYIISCYIFFLWRDSDKVSPKWFTFFALLVIFVS